LTPRAQQLATAVGVGAVRALNLGHMDLPTIGIILLIGIVKKSGIMLEDLPSWRSGNATCRRLRRFAKPACCTLRPILMATVAALLAGAPMMFGHATGSELRSRLGYSIVGGLALSPVLTWYTTHAVYLYLAWLGLDLKTPQAADRQSRAVSDAKALRVRQRARPDPDFVQRIAGRGSQ
jgi:multidrug efflux pump subunit AcrB